MTNNNNVVGILEEYAHQHPEVSLPVVAVKALIESVKRSHGNHL